MSPSRQVAKSPQIILALDVDSFLRAKYFVDLLYPQVKIFKVGLQLFTACGDKIIKYIRRKGGRVFLDLKFHDIPNTVCNAAREVARMRAVEMFTVHTAGGFDMLEAALKSASEEASKAGIKPPLIIGVTVLTSQENTSKILPLVLKRALLAREAGLNGVVCSVREAEAVRKKMGRDFIIVTPGIRLSAGERQDQKRVSTPAEAKRAGSDFLVVGRPVLEVKDPLSVIEEIMRRVESR